MNAITRAFFTKNDDITRARPTENSDIICPLLFLAIQAREEDDDLESDDDPSSESEDEDDDEDDDWAQQVACAQSWLRAVAVGPVAVWWGF